MNVLNTSIHYSFCVAYAIHQSYLSYISDLPAVLHPSISRVYVLLCDAMALSMFTSDWLGLDLL